MSEWECIGRIMLCMRCSVDNLEQFVEQLLIGKLHPYVRSAPVPQTDDGLIKVL